MSEHAHARSPAFVLASGPPEQEGDRRLRNTLAGRLSEIVAWPESRISRHERELAADVLIGLLRTSATPVRRRCAERLAQIANAPKSVLRYLACDEIEVARPLLESSAAFDDSDLVAVVRGAVAPHWRLVAMRRRLSEVVSDALIEAGCLQSLIALLQNEDARLSMTGVETLVRKARDLDVLAPLLARRAELSPAHGLTLFWWSDAETRARLLRRFAVERATLIHELGDLFAASSGHDWSDAEARTVMQFIERRQRNRAAAKISRFGSLEGAVEAAAVRGADPEIIAEIASLAGLAEVTGIKIFADPGGEPIAVLSKACGLKRPHFVQLWRSLDRPVETGRPSAMTRAIAVFETMAVARAQTVLRYWNWALTTDPSLAEEATQKPEPNPTHRLTDLWRLKL